MITTDTFAQFGRRMSATQGYPNVVIAETPNPIRQLDPESLLARVDAMLPAIVEGLTLPASEIERRLMDVAKSQIHPDGVVRSSVPV